MKTVAFVPIKLNNERLPGKNTMLLGSVPLCKYMLKTLTCIDGIDEIYIYCSDESIMEYAPSGVKFLKRDTYLDGSVNAEELFISFLELCEADVYIKAHVTAPFVRPDSIKNALNKVKNEGFDSAFSVQKLQTFAWFNDLPINYSCDKIPRTQDLEPIYIETTAFYVFTHYVGKILKRRIGLKPYLQLMDQKESVDINVKEDIELAEKYLVREHQDWREQK